MWCESLDKLQIVLYIEIQLNNEQKTMELLYKHLKCCQSKRKVDMKTEEVVLCLLHISFDVQCTVREQLKWE